MNTRNLILALVLLVVVVGGGIFLSQRFLGSGRIPALEYQAVYRLVPEKVSRSAAVTITLPATTQAQTVDIVKQVSFEPALSGHWLDANAALGAAAAQSADQGKTFYFQPDKQLEPGKHYTATLALASTETLRADFLAVADPEVSAILPHGDGEVSADTKISIVFNRPMVPLGTLDQFSDRTWPVSISPKTPGRFKWISTNTLQFVPETSLISSAQYTVKVGEGFRSLEGLDVKPVEASFSTMHLRYWGDGSPEANYARRTVVGRGYNEPFLVRFNQAVDLDMTKGYISVQDGGVQVPFVVKYVYATTTTQIYTGQREFGKIPGAGLFASVYDSLAQVISAKPAEVSKEDQTMLAIYPAGGEKGSWEPEHDYTLTVSRAYPKSGGNIFLDQSNTFSFRINKIYSRLEATSPRTKQASVGRFDPEGKLAIHFYEPIDLGKSRISGPSVSKVEYGDMCKDNKSNPCVTVPDRKVVLVSFNSKDLAPGGTTRVMLDPIISDTGATLTPKPLQIDIAIYKPLVIYSASSQSDLSRIIICSNNPLDASQKGKITSEPAFDVDNWQQSYLSYSSMNGSRGCGEGVFETSVGGYLIGQSTYNMTVSAQDVFGTSAQGAFTFTTRPVQSEDYQLRTYQQVDMVTVPSQTKLTFSASYLPSITATVCRLSPFDYNRVREDYKLSARSLCGESVSKTIDLSAGKPGPVIFTVDVKEYFPNVMGNYAVLLSSPLMPDSISDPWRYYKSTYVSVTNLIVTEKRINPLDTDNYDSLRLTGDQLNKLQNLYWVIDATTHQAVAGAAVSLYADGRIVGSSVTNDKGLAFVTPVAGADMAVVRYGSDTAVISGYSTKLSYASEAANFRKLYLYSDKPIYRPSQEVNIKGIYRLGYDGYYEVPPSQPATLTIRDSANTVVKEFTVTPNTIGTFNVTLALDRSARLGTYSACAVYQCTTFDVLEYAPAAFKVSLQTDKSDFYAGDTTEVKAEASYYFGVPLSNAGLDYHVSSQYYSFDKFTGEYFNFNNLTDDDMGRGYYYGDRYISQGHVALDDQGKGIIKPSIDFSKLNNPAVSKIIIVDATVKNEQGRSVSGQKSFVLHAAPVYIGSKLDEPFVSTSQGIAVQLKTVDVDGKPTSAKVKASLYKVSWSNRKVDGRNTTLWDRTRDLVKTFDANTDGQGDGRIDMPAQSQGEYQVDVESRSAGAAVGSRSWLYVYGGDTVSIQSRDDTSLELIPKSAEVKTGDMAEVLMKVPEGAGKALVTIERGKVFSYQIIDITGTLARFQFPVTDQYYPNVYVSVTVYAPDRAVRYGNYAFAVDSSQKKLSINITPDKKAYHPGDQVNLGLTVTDDSGRPVVADLSLAVVDMSVLALKGNPKKDLVTSFYGHVPLAVQTYSNFKTVLEQSEKEMADGKGGSGGDSKNQKSRGVFREVAVWRPSVMTNAQGKATVTFTLPDNLTTWQAEVVGATTDTRVGSAYEEFTTNKDLMVVPLKPRFLIPGDKFSLGATVFNHSQNEFDGTVTLSVPSLDREEMSSKKDIRIKAGESQTIYWNAVVPYSLLPGGIPYSIRATGSGLNDAIDDVLIVKENSAYEVTATAGQTSSSIREAVYVPSTILPDQGGLTMRSSATLGVFLSPALDYMMAYPYGCTEQIASQIRTAALLKAAHAIPNISTSSIADKVIYQGKEYTVDELVKLGLSSIYNRQNPDGGFKLWSEDRMSSYWATLEVLNTFDELHQLGYQIDSSAWDTAAQYAYSYYFSHTKIFNAAGAVDLASVLYVRDRYHTDSALNQMLAQATSRLLNDAKSPTGTLMSLSMVLHRYQISDVDARRADLMLENRLFVDSRGSFLDRSSNDQYPNTAISNTARYIGLLSVQKKQSPELSNMIRWLISSRAKDGAWGSTENTLAVVAGLTEYMRWQKETSAAFTLESSVNGTVVDRFDFTSSTILTQLSKTVPMSQLNSGALNTISFAKTGDHGTAKGNVYYDMSFKYYLPANTLGPRDEGFALKRGFYALSDTKGETPLEKAKPGDVLREHIEITVPATRNNVTIEDFIPAGMEIVDTSLATEDQSLSKTEVEVKYPVLWPDHTEWRDDRAFLYMSDLSPGTYEFDYLVRALVPGTYTQLPAQISEMYTPENFGRSGASLFTIEK